MLTLQTIDDPKAKGMRDPSVPEMRQAVASDVSAIRQLTREAYAKWVPVIGREPKPMIANFAEAVRNHRIDLLYVDGKLAGLIEMIPQASHLLIENVAVSPVFQGRDLGRKLMVHAEHVAVSLGYDEVRLYTNKLFAENVQVYRKLGYRVDREEEFKSGSAVHMSKSLGPAARPRAADV
jgi:ribosomal protein S18 acetylase RimI-like enzyme